MPRAWRIPRLMARLETQVVKGGAERRPGRTSSAMEDSGAAGWQLLSTVGESGDTAPRWRRASGATHHATSGPKTTTGRGRRPIQAAFAVNDPGGRNAKSLPPWRNVRSKLASPSWVLRLSPEGKR